MVIGMSIIVSPVVFYGSYNINIGDNVSLLSELKAPAGLLLVAGVFMVYAIFDKTKRDVALGLAVLIYLSYAASRAVSMVWDGVPASGLVLATAIEAIIGLTCLVLLLAGRLPMKNRVT